MKEMTKKPITRIKVRGGEEVAYLSVTVSKSEGEREILLFPPVSLAVEFLIAMALFIILIIPAHAQAQAQQCCW